ncbi:hypothetical protein A3K42_00010 [candidate division WWE3 bacterium RBG_13_37_7]|uniref:glucose-6-phosphate isomerase n=1 Tax=candidate division WWE3 bacterium RBG_13_37_7 TaxID=1802609 RepID=A0A1F4U1R3_UNCKA|nr:MAG: hypothetical protein A3K42_00010 [candidate division WWE3 bacterium RBG_13_37_7]
MNIKSIRSREALKEILYNPEQSNMPDPVYWVFNKVTKDKWENVTIISSSFGDGEFPKTYGHYHASANQETYELIKGTGIFLLQKRHYDKDGIWIPDIVDEVFFVKFTTPGERITITQKYGHSWSNIGDEPLILFDDWRNGHTPEDYEPIKRLKGLAYYLIRKGSEVDVVPNPNYKDLPQPKFVTPKEFAELQS